MNESRQRLVENLDGALQEIAEARHVLRREAYLRGCEEYKESMIDLSDAATDLGRKIEKLKTEVENGGM